jgi:prophage regulatory protein
MPKKFIPIKEASIRTNYSTSSLYRMIAEGTFPKQYKIGKRSIAFLESEINEWIEQKIADSNKAA